jgi:hypothetical protein
VTAYTSNGLPYQLGSDRPCDAPEVWCALTAALETKLASVDTTLARLSPSVPVAKLTRSTQLDIPMTVANNSQAVIPYEGVEVDTDNMVDFATSPYSIRPRRPGTYFVTAWMQFYAANFDNSGLYLTRGPVGSSFFVVAFQQQAHNASGLLNLFYLRVAGLAPWSSTDTVGFSSLFSAFGPGTLSLFNATLAAYWVNDTVVNV